MRRLHPDLVLIASALASVAALHGLDAALAPTTEGILDVADREGARVAVEARVLEVRHGAHGRFLVLADDATRIKALAGPGDGPALGDIVRAVGIVTRVDGAPAISIQTLDVVLASGRVILSPADVARAPWSYEGARVVLEGNVRSGAFAGEGASILLRGEPAPAADGVWLASGAIRYRTTDAAYVLVVDAWTRPS